MQEGGVIFFDLTQLILRVSNPTPDGIGRVELAYAQHLLAKYPGRVRFVFALPRLVQVIPARVAARYVKTIETVWREEDNISDSLVKELKAFLNTDHIFLNYSERQDRSRRSRQFQRLSMVANLLIGSALQFARPRNLGRYSHSKFANAYVCVSNSTVSSKWLIRWLARSPSVAGIFLLHDIIPISNPEFTHPSATIRHRHYVQRVAESAHTIIVNSAYTRDCLQKYAVSANLLLPEVVVAPLGVEAGFIRDAALGKTTPDPTTSYFVFTATIEPRKNHMMLLQVWQRLVDRFGPDCPKLLFIGRRGRPPIHPKNENTLDLIERAEGLRKYVFECPNVPDRLLIKLLANARAALFPSHVEGYGLPLAEALSLGTPVLCSDIPPFKEIAGDIPEYVDPLAGREWIRLITEYRAVDSPKRAAQMRRIKTFKPHSWGNHLSALDSMLSGMGVSRSEPATAAAFDLREQLTRP